MAARAGDVLGINFLTEFAGSEKGGVALVSFDMINQGVTGASDTITLGGGGQDSRVTSTDTLAVMIQKRRRDGKTVTLTGAAGCVAPGLQAGVQIFPQLAAVSAGNVISITVNTAASGGATINTTSAAWDRAAVIAVTYTAV